MAQERYVHLTFLRQSTLEIALTVLNLAQGPARLSNLLLQTNERVKLSASTTLGKGRFGGLETQVLQNRLDLLRPLHG